MNSYCFKGLGLAGLLRHLGCRGDVLSGRTAGIQVGPCTHRTPGLHSLLVGAFLTFISRQSYSHSYTHLILALGIVREPIIWGFITSKYPGIHDIGWASTRVSARTTQGVIHQQSSLITTMSWQYHCFKRPSSSTRPRRPHKTPRTALYSRHTYPVTM